MPSLPSAPPKPSRDSVTTIATDGSRVFLHPAETTGRYARARRWAAWLLIAIYVLLPWIPVNEAPAVFLDVAGRRFHLFGTTLVFQDTWLLFFVITGLAFSLFYVTALFGRVWCGWACPQTVFLEHVFRWIEARIEGDAVVRRALDAAPWTGKKLGKRAFKHAVFFLCSAAVAHLFLAYFVSLPELWAMMHASPGQHWGAFVFVFLASAILHLNFAWFREQLCSVICPYGRLQSALIDDHSLVVGYDSARGEPRGKLGTVGTGACIDCRRCVQVCPTGIDIRQGLQIECIACTACIDACDEVMDRIARPRGLIRYSSLQALAGRKTRWLRPRTLLYTGLLVIGAGVAGFSLSTVKPAALSLTRLPGAPYYVQDTGVRNQFLLRIVNKQSKSVRFRVVLSVAPMGVRVTSAQDAMELGPLAEAQTAFVLQQAREHYRGPFQFRVEVTDEARTFEVGKEAEFVGPDAALWAQQEVSHAR